MKGRIRIRIKVMRICNAAQRHTFMQRKRERLVVISKRLRHERGERTSKNYLLRFRFLFRLLKSFGSGSDFRQVTVPVPYVDVKKQFSKKNWKILAFLHSKFLPYMHRNLAWKQGWDRSNVHILYYTYRPLDTE
jgi:hypothetical protein